MVEVGQAQQRPTPRTGGPRITVVIPFLNAMRYLPRTAPGVLDAARRTGGVEIIYVDNHSSDGSREYLTSLGPDLRVLVHGGETIAELRNWGARQGSGSFLSFIDADCGIESTYFDDAMTELRSSGASATGCEYALPEHPHWIEKALYDLHYVGRNRDVHYINAGNFFLRRDAFDSVGGFREDLYTGEDADICQRLVIAGHRIRESTSVRAVHYGNPKSPGQHYRRTVWHGLGTFATVTRHRIDRPTVMLALHVVLSVAGVIVLFTSWRSLLARLAVAIVLQALVPATTVAYRIRQTGRVPRLDAAILLYWLYYWARLHALVLLGAGQAARYRK